MHGFPPELAVDKSQSNNPIKYFYDANVSYNHQNTTTATTTATTATGHRARCFGRTGDHPNGGADRELQCQHEGGTCEFFLICWMSRGLLQGPCDGLLRGCCHRTAKSANLATAGGGDGDTNSLIDLTHLPNTDYGPVTNEPSECNQYGPVKPNKQ